MKKILICLSLMLIAGITNDAYAKQRSAASACDIATSFISHKAGAKVKSTNILKASMKLAYTATAEKTAEKTLYVFNRGTKDGYVIVAADDCVDDCILGFSDNGSFDINNVPDNFKSWLNGYSQEIEYAIKSKGYAAVGAVKDIKYTTSVAPLLGETEWGQDSPYNLFTPVVEGKKTVVGCGATAMAQVMYYHKWPETGVGSKSYEMRGQTLSADFGATTYQWDLMKPVYDKNSSEESKNAVATLSYHCGISLESDYMPRGGTSASPAFLSRALANYFKYDKSISYICRNFYSYEDWTNILKKELDASRPVLYSGWSNDEGGHGFVCDGYNTDGFFHFNWGWDGSCNGYFKVFLYNCYNPADTNTGSFYSGYNVRQQITIGIQKDKGTPDFAPSVIGELLAPQFNKTNYRRNEPITAVFKEGSLFNMGVLSYTQPLYFTLYDKNGNIAANYEIKNDNLFSAQRNEEDIVTDIVINDDIADGDYTLYLTYKVPGNDGYVKAESAINRNYYHNVAIKDGNITIVPAENILNNLSCDNVSISEVHSNYIFGFSFTITNNGSEYYGPMSLLLFNKETKEPIDTLYTFDGIDILPGENFILGSRIKTAATPGDYILSLVDNNDDEIYTQPLTVYEEPKNFEIHLISTPKVISSDKNDIQIEIEIKNTADYIDTLSFMQLYKGDSDDSDDYIIVLDNIECKSNSVTNHIFHIVNSKLEAGDSAYFKINLGWNQFMIIDEGVEDHVCFKVSDSSGVNSVNNDNSALTISQTENSITLNSLETISSCSVYSTSGLIQIAKDNINSTNVDIDTSSLSSGVYILKANAAGTVTVKKFVIK